MSRRVFSLFYRSRGALDCAREPPLRPVSRQGACSVPALRALVSVRTLSTTGVLCETKEGSIAPPAVQEKTDGEKTEELQVESKKSEDVNSKMEAEAGANVKEQRLQDTVELKTELENVDLPKAASQNVAEGVQTEPVGVSEGLKTESRHEGQQVKSGGKEGLLELLGAMKVEVTTKRKLKVPKTPRSVQEAPPRSRPEEMESTISMFQHATRQAASQSDSPSPELVAAASAAAATLPDSFHVESELLRQLRQHEAVPDTQRKGEPKHIGNIIADMKVGKKQSSRPNARPANQIRFDDDGRGYTHDRGITGELNGVRRRKSAFSGKRLNIFTAAQETETDLVVGPTLWDIDLANHIAQAVNQRPRNGFEEMIQWTKEGKLWQYPIDNESGMDEEAKVPFHEHIFLERHLEDGFPQQGPIRHFMELVVTGLAKNPTLSVQQKLEHITWFREYFKQKEDVINEAEAYLS